MRLILLGTLSTAIGTTLAAQDTTKAPVAQPVEAVTIVEPIRAQRMADFEARRAKRTGFFLDREQITNKRPHRFSDVMRSVPGATVAPGGSGMLVKFRSCSPLLWIDGVRIPNPEIDDAVDVNDVAALEVYVSPATLPPQFRDIMSGCGAIIVWTR